MNQARASGTTQNVELAMAELSAAIANFSTFSPRMVESAFTLSPGEARAAIFNLIIDGMPIIYQEKKYRLAKKTEELRYFQDRLRDRIKKEMPDDTDEFISDLELVIEGLENIIRRRA